MIVTTAQLFKHAYGKYAIGAYNINNAEQAMGLFKGAIQSQAPFIIQISKGARSYTDKRMLEAIIRAAERRVRDLSSDGFLAVRDQGARERLIAAMVQLPDRLKLVLQLFFVEELNLTEIAAVLDVSVPRVHQLRAKALKDLRALMEGDGAY